MIKTLLKVENTTFHCLRQLDHNSICDQAVSGSETLYIFYAFSTFNKIYKYIHKTLT